MTSNTFVGPKKVIQFGLTSIIISPVTKKNIYIFMFKYNMSTLISALDSFSTRLNVQKKKITL